MSGLSEQFLKIVHNQDKLEVAEQIATKQAYIYVIYEQPALAHISAVAADLADSGLDSNCCRLSSHDQGQQASVIQ